MNSLNSTLIEGIATDKPIYSKNSDTAKCTFIIENIYRTKKDDEVIEDQTLIRVYAFGRVAENCNRLTKGKGVRVIGRLKQEELKDEQGNPYYTIVLISEHIELKPQLNSNTEKEQENEETVV